MSQTQPLPELTPELLSLPQKRGWKPGQTANKTDLQMKIIAGGADPRTALELTNNKTKVSDSAVFLLKKKYEKWSLRQPSVVKLAHNQVKRILKSEPREAIKYHMDGEVKVVESIQEIHPSDTNILAASMMVYDRYEPLIQRSINLNASIDFHPVDLSEFL